jgi:hypothetical protein
VPDGEEGIGSPIFFPLTGRAFEPMKQDTENSNGHDNDLQPLQLQVSADLYRAFQRCSWIIVNETGRGQVEIMEEMVRDFLVKHGC